MIEVGKKYRVIRSAAGNEGKIVTVTDYAGPPGFDGCDRANYYGDRWFIDMYLSTNCGRKVNHLGCQQLQPIDEDAGSWDSLSDIWTPERVGA